MDKYAARTRDISIHAPRKGSDGTSLMLARPLWYFYPRSPRGERHRGPVADRRHPLISIHAPREGSDGKNDGGRAGDCNFYPRSPRGERPTDWLLTGSILDISIHAPREGSDASWYASPPATQIFLSTLPARGATRCAPTRTHRARYFYPRSPRGERHFTPRKRLRPKRFLSTLPARGATLESLRLWC